MVTEIECGAAAIYRYGGGVITDRVIQVTHVLVCGSAIVRNRRLAMIGRRGIEQPYAVGRPLLRQRQRHGFPGGLFALVGKSHGGGPRLEGLLGGDCTEHERPTFCRRTEVAIARQDPLIHTRYGVA